MIRVKLTLLTQLTLLHTRIFCRNFIEFTKVMELYVLFKCSITSGHKGDGTLLMLLLVVLLLCKIVLFNL